MLPNKRISELLRGVTIYLPVYIYINPERTKTS